MRKLLTGLYFAPEDTTRQRLIKATKYLLASYGYEATTTRMIAGLAEVNLSAINFHFENKEKLVQAAVEDAAQNLRHYYAKLAKEIRAFLKEPVIDKDRAWGYIDRYLADRIQVTFRGEASLINIGIVEHENEFPESCQGIISGVVVRDNEAVLAELIEYVSDKKDRFQAALVARSITAAIMSYLEKPLLNIEIEKETGLDLEDLSRVEDCLHNYFMKSIRAVAVPPQMYYNTLRNS